MSRIITAALFLAVARWSWKAGYMAARVDAVQPFWRVSRKRVEAVLRLVQR